MPSSCTFFYDRPNSVYYSGELLNGRVILKTNKIKRVRGIYVAVKGEGQVQWTERRSRQNSQTQKRETYMEYYHNEQLYLSLQTLVQGEGDLPIGTHEYNFTASLPMHLPSSINSDYGHISYLVELRIDRPVRVNNCFSSIFTIIRPLNLNIDPFFSQPAVDEEQKYFCCCCCETGPMHSELRAQYTGYAPGQIINFTLTIDNEANKDIDGCFVELIQTLTFHSQMPEHKTKTVQRVLGSTPIDGANRYTKKVHNGSIQVPSVPPTTNLSSDIIRISYSLKAVVDCGFCSNDEELRIMITIGTTPLIITSITSGCAITMQPTAPFNDPLDTEDDQPPQYGTLAPPSFEEATALVQPKPGIEVRGVDIIPVSVHQNWEYNNLSTRDDTIVGVHRKLPHLPTKPKLSDDADETDSRSNLPPYPDYEIFPMEERPHSSPSQASQHIGWRV